MLQNQNCVSGNMGPSAFSLPLPAVRPSVRPLPEIQAAVVDEAALGQTDRGTDGGTDGALERASSPSAIESDRQQLRSRTSILRENVSCNSAINMMNYPEVSPLKCAVRESAVRTADF